MDDTLPSVLCIGGHDPTGGAGLQADIEAVAANGGRAITLVSCLTEQDTRNVRSILATPLADLRSQARTLLADLHPDAIKIGLLAETQQVELCVELLAELDHVPCVWDPVLTAGGGMDLSTEDTVRLMRRDLLPEVFLLTPNCAEARRLGGLDEAEQAAAQLCESFQASLLLTAADETGGEQLINRLYQPGQATLEYPWPLLPHTYHGSGCTLAAACATRIALGDSVESAVQTAQSYTWNALKMATPTPHQWLPRRVEPCQD